MSWSIAGWKDVAAGSTGRRWGDLDVADVAGLLNIELGRPPSGTGGNIPQQPNNGAASPISSSPRMRAGSMSSSGDVTPPLSGPTTSLLQDFTAPDRYEALWRHPGFAALVHPYEADRSIYDKGKYPLPAAIMIHPLLWRVLASSLREALDGLLVLGFVPSDNSALIGNFRRPLRFRRLAHSDLDGNGVSSLSVNQTLCASTSSNNSISGPTFVSGAVSGSTGSPVASVTYPLSPERSPAHSTSFDGVPGSGGAGMGRTSGSNTMVPSPTHLVIPTTYDDTDIPEGSPIPTDRTERGGRSTASGAGIAPSSNKHLNRVSFEAAYDSSSPPSALDTSLVSGAPQEPAVDNDRVKLLESQLRDMTKQLRILRAQQHQPPPGPVAAATVMGSEAGGQSLGGVGPGSGGGTALVAPTPQIVQDMPFVASTAGGSVIALQFNFLDPDAAPFCVSLGLFTGKHIIPSNVVEHQFIVFIAPPHPAGSVPITVMCGVGSHLRRYTRGAWLEYRDEDGISKLSSHAINLISTTDLPLPPNTNTVATNPDQSTIADAKSELAQTEPHTDYDSDETASTCLSAYTAGAGSAWSQSGMHLPLTREMLEMLPSVRVMRAAGGPVLGNSGQVSERGMGTWGRRSQHLRSNTSECSEAMASSFAPTQQTGGGQEAFSAAVSVGSEPAGDEA